MKIGIVIPVLNQFQMAIDVLCSVRTEHDWHPYIVPQYRLRWPLGKAWNWGIEQAGNEGCKYVLVINDDILFSNQTIDKLVCGLEDRDDITMITGCNMRGHMEPDEIMSYKTDASDFGENPDFACFMVRPSILETFGTFDENFTPAYFEDNDYHRRIKLLGGLAGSTAAAPYYHYGSKTQNADSLFPTVSGEMFENNRAYYVTKWGGVPGEELFVQPYDNISLNPRDWVPLR